MANQPDLISECDRRIQRELSLKNDNSATESSKEAKSEQYHLIASDHAKAP